MTAPLHPTATLRDLLLGDTDGTPTDSLTESLHSFGTLNGFVAVGPVRAAAEHEVAGAVTELLSSKLIDLLATGWKKYQALRQAARRTLAAPKDPEVVVLATHQIKSAHHPSVEVFVDGISMGTIEFTVCVSFTLTGVRAVVNQGRLTEIKTGNCTAAGSLAVAGVEAVHKQRSVDLPGAVRLRGGIALLENTSPGPQLRVSQQAAGGTGKWHPDPTGRYELRWWDGSRWTDRVATGGRMSTDPLAGQAAS